MLRLAYIIVVDKPDEFIAIASKIMRKDGQLSFTREAGAVKLDYRPEQFNGHECEAFFGDLAIVIARYLVKYYVLLPLSNGENDEVIKEARNDTVIRSKELSLYVDLVFYISEFLRTTATKTSYGDSLFVESKVDVAGIYNFRLKHIKPSIIEYAESIVEFIDATNAFAELIKVVRDTHMGDVDKDATFIHIYGNAKDGFVARNIKGDIINVVDLVYDTSIDDVLTQILLTNGIKRIYIYGNSDLESNKLVKQFKDMIVFKD